MARADMQQTTYGAFERFLYFFLIPMIYSSVLVFILFVIFNEDVRTSVLRTANNIPIIREIVPDPKEDSGHLLPSAEIVQIQKEARQQVAAVEEQLKTAIETSRQKDNEIKALKEQIASLEQQLEDKKLSAEQYEQRIQSLASLYAGMNPSKAAPILENLPEGELVLILSRMTVDEQVAVLQRMNPRIAANASMKLKDLDEAEDAQIAALQSRIALLEEQLANRANELTMAQLAETFAAMDAARAAAVLLEMVQINENNVIGILRSMNSGTRSAVLSAISETNSTTAARLTAKLAN